MTEPIRDVASRWKPPPEFLRELPELICGKDPELLRPEARAWLLRDPRAREYADQIAGAVAQFADLPQRMSARSTEPLEKRARRGVERAARQLPVRLAEVLWPIFLQDLDRVAEAAGGVVYVPGKPDLLTTLDRPHEIRTSWRLFEIMQSQGSYIRPQGSQRSLAELERSVRSLNSGLGSPEHSARTALNTIEALIPSSVALEYARLSLRQQTGNSAVGEEWARLLERARFEGFTEIVFAGAQLAFARLGRDLESMRLANSLLGERPTSAVIPNVSYLGVLSSIAVGDRRQAAKFVEIFQTSLESHPGQRPTWERQFLSDGVQWRSVLATHGDCVRAMIRAVGGQP